MTAGKHRYVSAAEKRAELVAEGKERRNCECHGMPMRWRPSSRYSAGGAWDCQVRRLERQRRRRQRRTPLERLKDNEYLRQYMARRADERDSQRLATLLKETQ
jgi:hypothetical protein